MWTVQTSDWRGDPPHTTLQSSPTLPTCGIFNPLPPSAPVPSHPLPDLSQFQEPLVLSCWQRFWVSKGSLSSPLDLPLSFPCRGGEGQALDSETRWEA